MKFQNVPFYIHNSTCIHPHISQRVGGVVYLFTRTMFNPCLPPLSPPPPLVILNRTTTIQVWEGGGGTFQPLSMGTYFPLSAGFHEAETVNK